MNLLHFIPLHLGFLQALLPFLPAITTALGIGGSLAGANKQAKDQAAADAANRAAIAEQDRQSWGNYLLQRGLYEPNAQTGVIPGVPPGAAMNTKLPLWANLRPPTQPFAGPVVRRKAGR